MLTGKELGAAIEAARKLKKVTKKAIAEHFGVSQPSIQDWVNRGTIDKSKLPDLWEYFRDVVGPSHWGLKSFAYPAPATSASELLRVAEPVPGAKLSAKAFSLGSRLDALQDAEHRRIAYALMSNILDQYEALQAPAPAPRPATKSTPRARRSPSRQPSR